MMTVAASAQNEVGEITVAPTVGLNFANATNVEDSKMKVGPLFGVTAEYGLTEKLGVSAGLHFSMQGYKIKESDETFTTKMNYLNIPILANYYVYEGLAVKAGVQPGILLSAKEESVDFKEHCNTLDFSIPIGASYEISNFVIDARYNIPLTKVNKHGNKSEKNSVFQVTVGYKFKL